MGLKVSTHGPGRGESNTASDSQQQLFSSLTQSFHIRHLVSRQRRRMLIDGYDLDMTYITPHILAMSFPAERIRAMYRNPIWQVQSVLDARHSENYKVYNLCIEETYDLSHFHGRMERFPIDDNHVPPLQMIKLFCENVGSWLSSDPKNIAVIHCMAGKGRTGLMVCAYLVYNGMSVEEALQLYAQRRTTNNAGVTIPSQCRYVGYWSSVLSFPRWLNDGPPIVNLPPPCSRELRQIRLYDAINTDSVFFVVSELQAIPGQGYHPPMEVARSCCRRITKGYQRTNSPRYYVSFVECGEGDKSETATPRPVAQMDTESPMLYQKTCLEYYSDKPLRVTGDIRITFYQKMIGSRLFYACFNTAFIKNSLLQLSVRELDKVGSKGRSICGPNLCMELLFGPPASSCIILLAWGRLAF